LWTVHFSGKKFGGAGAIRRANGAVAERLKAAVC
jgi:hypothetical protein